MRLALCLIICLALILSYASANTGKYTVIGPGTIHSNEKYTAAVAVHHINQTCNIKVGIVGSTYRAIKYVEVSQHEVKHVEFDLPSLEEGNYNLTAEGVNCFENFKNTTQLNYNKFNNHVKIQTDKGWYKPGDYINYRVLIMDKDLKPAKPEKDALIWFEDDKHNIIKEIKDFKTVKGVHTGKFKISEFPVTGVWRMGVKNGARYQRTINFKVDKYVLPKYVVNVEATKSVSVKDGDMQVIVKASYTYGKPLDGKVTIELSLPAFEIYKNHAEPPSIIKTVKVVKGKAKIDLNVKEYSAYLTDKESPTLLAAKATVEEEFTGEKIIGFAYSTVYPYRYAPHCATFDTCQTFEADNEKDVVYQITYIDGSNLNDTKSTVELVYKEVLLNDKLYYDLPLHIGERKVATTSKMPISENRTFIFKGNMNETGFVTFKVSLPDLIHYKGYSHYYKTEIKYLDEKKSAPNVYQYRKEKEFVAPKEEVNEPKEYFKLKNGLDLTNTLQLNKVSQFVINSSEPLSYFDYNVIGRGNILKSGHVYLPDKPKLYNLTLTPESSWAPNFAIYVYYVDEAGGYHYAEQSYYVGVELENQISITADEEVEPGDNVVLRIKTTPNSFVGLMAVDQNTLLLSPNNNFDANEFAWAKGSYRTSTPHQGGYSEYPGTTSGCVTLTNADYFYNWTRPDFESWLFEDRIGPDNNEFSLRSGAVNLVSANYAGSGITTSSHLRIRKDFSETWIFDDIENTEADEFRWSKKIPDSITSWILTAFSMSPTKGLGVTRDATKITTFQPFFISVRLPYSVKRGEIINVPALVFNYLDKALKVEVTLDNSDDEYEFTDFDNKIISEQKLSKKVHVPTNSAAGVSFLIKAKVIGNIMLKFTAISPIAGDAVHKSMKVVPEGNTKYANRAYFVHLKKESEVKSSFELELPKDLVSDSEHVEVGVMGDILGPVLNNLDNLVRLPTGCGEQTMSNLLPNYLVMKYLKNSKRLTHAMETKLLNNLENGYQNILNYRHTDGSFSSFGPPQPKQKPRNGSTWLTAYVVRSLLQIKEFVNVNDKIIEEGLDYLSKQQAANGTFTEKGDYFYASQSNNVVLTSAVVLAILENTTYVDKYSNELRKGLQFIAQNIRQSDSLYDQAIGTYTLNKAKHKAAKEELFKLKSLVQSDSDRMWWSSENKQFGLKWWYYVLSNDVEITSYALLTLLDQEFTKVADVVPIIKWLIGQRNSYGGFASTQDTVVGLTALVKFAQFADYEPATMNVDIESEDKSETIKLTKDNGIIYQIVEMPQKTKSLVFNAKGTGSALVQISYQYNIFQNDSKPSFTINIERVDDKSRPAHFEMSVCVNYVGEGSATNMALLEISTPSGYIFENDRVTATKQVKRIRHTEVKNFGSLLVVYFDHLYKNNETCLTIQALRRHSVANQKPVPIVLYDYYDTSKKVTSYYQVESQLCDICDTREECSKCK